MDMQIKIKNNSVYGKQMETVRNRVNIELVNNNQQRLLKVLSHPSYKKQQCSMKIWLQCINIKKKLNWINLL